APAGLFVKLRAVSFGAERGRQMADPARLGEHLPPHSLLFGKIIAGLLCDCALGRRCEHEQTKQSCFFHRFPPFTVRFVGSYAVAERKGRAKGGCSGRQSKEM